MQWPMNDIFNSTEEVTTMSEYPGIRLYRLKAMTSDEPQDDLIGEDFITWANTKDAYKVKSFSAVCLLTAKYMADILGKEKVRIC